jgi:hypothetical protein
VHPALALRAWDIGFRGIGSAVPECQVLRVARLDSDSHSPAVRVQHSIRLHHRRRSVPRGARASGFRSSHLVTLHCLLRVVGAICVWCLLRQGLYGRVLHLVCVVCAVLRTGCPLPAARCSPHTKCGISHVLAFSCMSYAVCCLLSVKCCSCPLPVPGCLPCGFLRGVCCFAACGLLPCCLLSFPRCLFLVICCLLPVARCPLPVARCLLRCMSLLLAAYCLQSGACCLLRVACRLLFAAYCPLHVVRMLSLACFMSCRPLHVVCCMVHVVCCLLRICQWSRQGCLLRYCCPSDRVCCTLSVAYRTLVTLRVARCESAVACCMTHVSCRMLALVRRLSHPACRLFCCMPSLQSGAAPSHTQRIAGGARN